MLVFELFNDLVCKETTGEMSAWILIRYMYGTLKGSLIFEKFHSYQHHAHF